MESLNEYTKNESSEPNDKQMYSALSFCIMLVFVGIPLWWKTTEVYRVSLPYSQIDTLHNINTQIQISIYVVTLDDHHGAALINELKTIFKISKLYKVCLIQHSVDKTDLISYSSLEEMEKKIKHPHLEGSLQLFEVFDLNRFTSDNIVIGQYRTVYFSPNTDAMKLFKFLKAEILKEDLLIETISQINLPMVTNLNFIHKMPPSDDFDILFTILNPEPDFLNVKFDVSKAIEGIFLLIQEYVTPFLRNFKDMNGFHIKSQWLYFISLEAQPKFVNTTDIGPHYALSEDLLPHVITPLEKKLASHVSKHPCLNLVLFIPPCSLAPLQIYTKKGFRVEGANAFISPRWGGIQIYNPNSKTCISNGKVTVEPDKQNVMAVFIKQLRLLLGISRSSSSEIKNILTSFSYLQLWEKDSLLRIRTVEQLTSAKLTIQSLSKLLGKINNIVINDQVGEAIYSALGNIYETTENLVNGKLIEAYNKSKSAFLSSEKAFTDPSLLALLYFPDDQKYAVYIPLFLPIMIPILISFKHIKHWAEKKLSQPTKFKTD